VRTRRRHHEPIGRIAVEAERYSLERDSGVVKHLSERLPDRWCATPMFVSCV
jgi:hypothetical protein